MRMSRKRAIKRAVLALAFPLCLAGGVAVADKLDDFKEAAGKTGCDAIPYSSERSECKSQQEKKNASCKDFACNRAEVEKLQEKLKEKRQNLADAKSRNNEAAVPDLERAIKALEEELKARKAEAHKRIERCDDCIEARQNVQKVFAAVKSRVKNESDPALKPYIDQLVGHYDQGAKEHEKPLEEVKNALASCKWVASISI